MRPIDVLLSLFLLFTIKGYTQSQPVEVMVQMRHSDAVTAVAFSPSGEVFATGSTDCSIKLWDFKTGKELRRFFGTKESIDNIYFSFDGNTLFGQAGGSAKPKLFFWDVRTGGLKNTIDLAVWEKVIGSKPSSNEFITTILEDKTQVKTIPDGKLVSTYKGFNIISPDGQYQVVRKEKIRGYEVWRLKPKTLVCSLPDRFGDCQFRFSPDSKTLVMYMVYVTVISLDDGSEKKIEFFEASSNDCWEVSRNGEFVVSRSGKQSVHVWDLKSDEVKPFRFGTNVTSVGASPYPDEFFVGLANGDYQLINRRSGKVRLQSYGAGSEVLNVSTTADPNLFLARSATGDFVWSMKQVKVLHELGCYQAKHSLKRTLVVPEQMASSPHNNLAVTANTDFTVSVWDVQTGREIKRFSGHDTLVSGVDISPNGEWVASVPKHGKAAIWSVENGRLAAQLNEVRLFMGGLPKFLPDSRELCILTPGELNLFSVPSGAFISKHNEDVGEGQVAISPDGKYLVSPFLSTPLLFSLVQKKPLGRIGDLPDGTGTAFSADGGYLVLSSGNNASVIDMSGQRVISHLAGHSGTILQAAFTDSNHLLTCSTDGTVRYWDAPAGKLIATFIANSEQEYGVITSDNYYTMGKALLPKIHFVQGLSCYSFDNFDLVYNRPDIVAQRLGKADDVLIKALRAAYLKRIKRMGFTEEQLSGELHLPQFTVLSKDIPLETEDKHLTVRVSCSDTKYPLDRLKIYINDVPILGIMGLPLKDKKILEYSDEFNLELLPGRNKIQLSCVNAKGVESHKSTFEVYCTAPHATPTLYLVNIGVSEFSDKPFNLRYAAKDATDLANTLKQSKSYARVVSIPFLNSQATAENIARAKEALMQTHPEDVVIVFVATHGLLDSNFNYYLATTNVNFENPSERGLLYDDLENLVDGIPARSKLILLDACHSGEVDKEDVQTLAGGQTPEGLTDNVKARGFKALARKDNVLGLKNTFELMRELFIDLSRGTGSVVVSSAGGAEYAFESSEWSNGVFTYVLLEGLKTGNADANRDGRLDVAEIQDYVFRKVPELTGGRQNPTFRKTNFENNFVIF
jgi:WD40 repeat protein